MDYNELLIKAKTMVLATSSLDGKPQAATVLFAHKDGLFYFYTFNDSRKYHNLSMNSKVSIVLHVDDAYAQIDGVAQELGGEEVMTAKNLIIEKKGSTSGFDEDPRSRYFKIKPTWIRTLKEQTYPPQYTTILTDKSPETIQYQ